MHLDADIDDDDDSEALALNDCDGDDDGVVAAALVGIREGESRFVVDPVQHERWRTGRLPREDGREWAPGSEGEGGAYEATWRSEDDDRQRLLESHPDYVFLTLVAGHSNMLVKHLFDDDGLQAALLNLAERRRRHELALEEVRASAREAALQVQDLQRETAAIALRLVDLRAARDAADPAIAALQRDSVVYRLASRAVRHLQRQRAIADLYTTVPLRSDDALQPIRDGLGREAAAEVRTADARGDAEPGSTEDALLDRLRSVAQPPKNLVVLANDLIDLWMWQSDPDAFEKERQAGAQALQQARELFAQQRVATATAMLVSAQQEFSDAEAPLLRSFRAALVYMSTVGVLVVSPEDVAAAAAGAPAPADESATRPLYLKYGGTLLRRGAPALPQAPVQISDFYTSAFRARRLEVLARAERDDELRSRLEDVRYRGPYVSAMREQRAWTELQIDARQTDEQSTSQRLASARALLQRLRAGRPAPNDVAPRYTHRRGWVANPRVSGVVRVKPIITSAIGRATTALRRYAPYGDVIDEGDAGAEFLQHDEQIRGDFSLLVAVQVALASILQRKQYLPQWSREFTALERGDVMSNLKRGYEVYWDAAVGRNKARLLAIGERPEEARRRELLRDRRDLVLLA